MLKSSMTNNIRMFISLPLLKYEPSNFTLDFIKYCFIHS